MMGCRRTFACDATVAKGDEMGWFEHGSTIVVFAPEGFTLCETVREGHTVAGVGEKLMKLAGIGPRCPATWRLAAACYRPPPEKFRAHERRRTLMTETANASAQVRYETPGGA